MSREYLNQDKTTEGIGGGGVWDPLDIDTSSLSSDELISYHEDRLRSDAQRGGGTLEFYGFSGDDFSGITGDNSWRNIRSLIGTSTEGTSFFNNRGEQINLDMLIFGNTGEFQNKKPIYNKGWLGIYDIPQQNTVYYNKLLELADYNEYNLDRESTNYTGWLDSEEGQNAENIATEFWYDEKRRIGNATLQEYINTGQWSGAKEHGYSYVERQGLTTLADWVDPDVFYQRNVEPVVETFSDLDFRPFSHVGNIIAAGAASVATGDPFDVTLEYMENKHKFSKPGEDRLYTALELIDPVAEIGSAITGGIGEAVAEGIGGEAGEAVQSTIDFVFTDPLKDFARSEVRTELNPLTGEWEEAYHTTTGLLDLVSIALPVKGAGIIKSGTKQAIKKTGDVTVDAVTYAGKKLDATLDYVAPSFKTSVSKLPNPITPFKKGYNWHKESILASKEYGPLNPFGIAWRNKGKIGAGTFLAEGGPEWLYSNFLDESDLPGGPINTFDIDKNLKEFTHSLGWDLSDPETLYHYKTLQNIINYYSAEHGQTHFLLPSEQDFAHGPTGGTDLYGGRYHPVGSKRHIYVRMPWYVNTRTGKPDHEDYFTDGVYDPSLYDYKKDFTSSGVPKPHSPIQLVLTELLHASQGLSLTNPTMWALQSASMGKTLSNIWDYDQQKSLGYLSSDWDDLPYGKKLSAFNPGNPKNIFWAGPKGRVKTAYAETDWDLESVHAKGDPWVDEAYRLTYEKIKSGEWSTDSENIYFKNLSNVLGLPNLPTQYDSLSKKYDWME